MTKALNHVKYVCPSPNPGDAKQATIRNRFLSELRGVLGCDWVLDGWGYVGGRECAVIVTPRMALVIAWKLE